MSEGSPPLTKKQKVDEPGEDYLESDPGMIFILGTPDDVHACLGMPAVAHLTPALQPGINAAGSVQNLYRWLDSIVESVVADAAFVNRTLLGTRIDGCYHNLLQHKHSKIEALFGRYTTWASELENAGLSAGTYVAVEGAGTGSCNLISKILGPFLTA